MILNEYFAVSMSGRRDTWKCRMQTLAAAIGSEFNMDRTDEDSVIKANLAAVKLTFTTNG